MKYFTEIRMTEENERKLFEKYNKIFIGRNKPITENLMSFGFECGDGWYNIIDSLCANIQGYIDQQEGKVRQIEATQVKEKFGTLRFYTNHIDDYVDGVISMAECMSARTCESCGNPGEANDSGWIITLCGTCREKQYRRWREEDYERKQLSFNF